LGAGDRVVHGGGARIARRAKDASGGTLHRIGTERTCHRRESLARTAVALGANGADGGAFCGMKSSRATSGGLVNTTAGITCGACSAVHLISDRV